jgi:hypothetical protein
MIVALLNTPENEDPCVIFILEPANIEKLQLGQPIAKSLHDFMPGLKPNVRVMLGYTPDIVWVTEQMAKGRDFGDVMRASMDRKPVYTRELDPEVVKKVTVHPEQNRIDNQTEETTHGTEEESS